MYDISNNSVIICNSAFKNGEICGASVSISGELSVSHSERGKTLNPGETEAECILHIYTTKLRLQTKSYYHVISWYFKRVSLKLVTDLADAQQNY